MNFQPDTVAKASFWTALAKRSDDGAFECNGGFQSGVPRKLSGLPPQSEFAPVVRRHAGREIWPGHINAGQFDLRHP
jgi:hypothetical protein